MDLKLSTEDVAFRDEVRAFLDEKFTDELREGSKLTPAIRSPQPIAHRWAQILGDKGWLCHTWPREFGGPGWNAIQRYIYELECNMAETPYINNMGVRMVGPVIIKHGSQEQKDFYLPKILKDDIVWCQGYSEPGSGSDLASLQTKAIPDGDDYVINGSKIWTTGAHHSDHMFCLVRTSNEGKPQQGISFLVFSMDRPGITVKPLLTLAGDHEFNEVFFDDVRVPKSSLVGELNKGWTVAKYLLEFERGAMAYSPPVSAGISRLKHICEQERSNDGTRLADDPAFMGKVASLEIQTMAAEMTEKRVMSALSTGQSPGPAASIFKLRGSELIQEMLELTMNAIAYYGAVYQKEAYEVGNNIETIAPEYGLIATSKYLNQRGATIYAGSSEVQRNSIAKLVLRL